MNKIKLLALLIGITFISCKSDQGSVTNVRNKPLKVELINHDGNYQLLKDGKPYFIKGAGAEIERIAILSECGANSCRTWSTKMPGFTAKEYLDMAHKQGLTVTMGLDVKKERLGFDYNDTAAVRKQLEYIKGEVLKYKDHPALIIWGIGNELNLNYTNPKVWNAVNDISKMIHEIDTNHLTTTMLAGINESEVNHIAKRCPDIDFLSIQMYGDLYKLQSIIEKSGYDGPYMVTEWGPTGHWEVEKTEWGVPIEPTSKQKSESFIYGYNHGIKVDKERCLGSYVFYWGQKQERTPTWYSLFTVHGDPLAPIDAMHYLWNNQWPENKAPQLDSVLLNGETAPDNIRLKAGRKYDASVFIQDEHVDSLTYKWEIMKESTDLGVGGDAESIPPRLNGLITEDGVAHIQMNAPGNSGAYRLFVYITDDAGKKATANIPFYVD